MFNLVVYGRTFALKTQFVMDDKELLMEPRANYL